MSGVRYDYTTQQDMYQKIYPYWLIGANIVMQIFPNDNVSKSEWRWVSFWSGILIIITFIPYIWASLSVSEGWHFFGILAIPQDGASYLSKIREGYNGAWMTELRYTPEAHNTNGIFVFYTFLGHIARIFGFSDLVIFHLARMATSYVMFSALYQLGANTWRRIRPRRLFFWLVIIGSGFGWLAVTIRHDVISPDIYAPEAFPFYAAFSTPHYALSIAMLALIATRYLDVFRHGFDALPTTQNGGLSIILYTIVLALIEPTVLSAIGTAIFIFMIWIGWRNRAMPWFELRWYAMVFLPAFPVLLYYVLVFSNDPILEEYNTQLSNITPNILVLLIGYGTVIILALPSIYRSARHFRRDGDQFMLIWLFVNLILLYLPVNVQRRLLIGLTIPLAYFAIRAIEDYWLDRIPERYHLMSIILLFVVILPSNVLAIVLPVYGVANSTESGVQVGTIIEEPYTEVYVWLAENGNVDEVVLASPQTSLWIPVESDLRVVYGHQLETVPVNKRRTQVEDFYTGQDCSSLFADNIGFSIDYVVWGMRERELAEVDAGETPACISQIEQQAMLTIEFADGDIMLYILREPR